ncbi:hypothetical protein CAEBREN_21019 [Caenorhabditis brenneri]|uniref:Glutaredoxin domain-containing protein n=1 Tax=Caenorhabditis brenneri TaxID=135651 RepID=G0MIG1_CAEBE|nr:hypothetical protein CAEBREN_21019 [Caenorhabditis brenneri]
MLRIITITMALTAIVAGELSKTKEDKTLKDLEDKIVNDIITHKVMVYSKTYCPWSKRLKVILANYEIDDMKIKCRKSSRNILEEPLSHSCSSVESLLGVMTKQKQLKRKESFDQCLKKLMLCKFPLYSLPSTKISFECPLSTSSLIFTICTTSLYPIVLSRFTNRVPVPDNGA